MRMEALTLSTLLLLALAPSLLPSWRSMLLAAAGFLALLLAGFVSMLWHFGATAEEGPAFAGLFILAGAMAVILVSSCAIRFFLDRTMANLARPNAVRLRRVLIGSGVLVAGLAALGLTGFFVHHGFAMKVGAAAAWLAVVAWLTPREPARRC